MIHSVTVKNYAGDELILELMSPEKSGLVVQSIEGLGPVEANINTTSGSNYDGATFNSARIDTRNIVLDLIFMQTNLSIEDIRLLTYKMFPIKKIVTLTFKTGNREAYISGYVESNEPDIFSELEGCQISIICPDPYFYSKEQNLTAVKNVTSEFQFPFSVEQRWNKEKDRTRLGFCSLDLALKESIYDVNKIEFGFIKESNYGEIVYMGDESTGVIIEIHFLGDVSGLSVFNTVTKQSIYFDSSKILEITGEEIKQGDDIIINTRKGSKSIFLRREGLIYNILNSVNKDLDWIQITKGLNRFAFSAEVGEEYVRCYVYNSVLYEGI